GDFVDLFVQRDAFLQVLELHRAADLGEDGEGVRIPLRQRLAERDMCTVFHLQLRTIDDLVALLLTATVVNDGDGAGAVHGDQITGLGADGGQVDEAHDAGVLRVEVRLLGDARCGTTDVEGTHGELRSGLTDGLRRDDANCLAQLDRTAGGQV